VFNRLSTFLNRQRGLRPAPHVAAVAVHNDHLWPNLAETQAQSLVYQQSPWVYIAVNRIAEAAALVPLKVLRLDGEQRTEVERHPVEALLDAPNPYLSRFELFEQTIGMLELTGNAYWFLAGDAFGTPTQLWPLRPDRVSIVPDAANYVRGYLYEIDGQRIPLAAAEVIHFKRWHPANDYYGLSALEAARLAIVGDRAMAEWNRNTFGKDNGVPAGIVHIKEAVSDADFERIKREWRQSYGGPQRRTAFLRGSSIEWRNIGLSHSELDFLNGREAHRNEILNLFGIPVGLVSENATEANAKVAERIFVERTLWPKLVRLAQKITQELLPFWPGAHIAEFDDIRPTDVQTRLQEIRTAYRVLSINEIRERYYRLPAVEWGARPVGAPEPNAVSRSDGETDPQRASQPADNGNTAETTAETTKAALDELERWERFVLKRWGRANNRSFEVRALPDEIAFEVAAGLLAAETPGEARHVFTSAKSLLVVEAAEAS
jgi:HK97 family phage portal protein